MTDDLDTLSDEALNELFAIEVAGYKRLRYCTPGVAYLIPPLVVSYFTGRGDDSWKEAEPSDKTVWFSDVFKEYAHFKEPRFTIDANAVLPYLEQYPTTRLTIGPDCRVMISSTPGYMSCPPVIVGDAVASRGSLARAAVIALIRAKRSTSIL